MGHAVAVCARSQDQIQSTQEQIQATGGKSVGFACDVGNRNEVLEVIDRIREELGEVDILVNNAGTAHSAKFLDTELETWQHVMQVNFFGPIHFTQAVLPAMLESGWGRIINIASVAGLRGLEFASAYVASKHALMGLTRTLALELADSGVTVNAICPGWVETQMLENSMQTIIDKTGRSRDVAMRAILASSGQPRVISPNEIAEEVGRLIDQGVNGEEVVMVGA
jgi:NAD(P)-dependent dehydrogenase (short-subunit alcohol dehydrogenase family)